MTIIPHATTYVNASCQCELNAFRVGFDTASLPLSVDLCHCSTCRHSSGQMAASYVPIKGVPLQRTHGLSVHSSRSPSRAGLREDDAELSITSHHGNMVVHPIISNGKLAPPSVLIEEVDVTYDLDELKAYRSSPNVTRYFCKSCSAHIFWVHHKSDGDVWMVTVGVLEKIAGIAELGYHQYVGDTRDGGLADHLRMVGGVKLPRYKEEKDTEVLPYPWRADNFAPHNSDENCRKKEDDRLEGFCHCGTISFTITRPSEVSFAPSAAYPDLLYPHGVSLLSKINNSKDEKWWLRPVSSSSPTKYLAGHCMCTFCRLSSGSEIQSWAFVPIANIVQTGTGAPLCLKDQEERPHELQQYISSPGEYIEFCGTCGATAFSWQAGTPSLVQVSIGLLNEEKQGARADGWFEWHRARVSFEDKALQESVARGLADGLKTVL